ncbi:hypothetical protein Taro_002088 [Colocasia esculenta]|uniref:Uncharacterized protein n=1 Tax=Colocasia esculenta TaxID=4460 RepID=A0A843TKL6_COLES|nr:hypothetical protein [Colocasia esculenta]
MWTFRVAVVLGGRGVDANLRILQVLKGGWAIVERVALLNCARKRRGVVQFPWELEDGSFPTEPVTSEAHPYPPQVRARRTFHDRRPVQSRAVAVQGRYLQLYSGSSSSKSLVWLIEEIGVVEEMIRRKAPSV